MAATLPAPIPPAWPRPALRSRPIPPTAARYTARGNLVAVVSNGTAVLGLGNIGALASKPVMEGKAVLFKKFANIDCFDIEVNESDPEKLADIVCALEPSFGASTLRISRRPTASSSKSCAASG
jgi:malate dehydrogenase (oxaloacetate-decarboxylating)(NADP+)